MTRSQEALTTGVDLLLATLHQSGVNQVVLSPGSRSTPLAIVLGQMQDAGKISLFIDVDERSAAFFALGIAKATSEPVLLVCTSGTAAANYYPAICEAFISKVPLIVLTADRPPELQEIGAPQTINQVELYGKQVKHFYQLPVPEPDTIQEARRYLPYICQKAVHTALSHPSGPVHLNLPLRKPLMPETVDHERSGDGPIENLRPDLTLNPQAKEALATKLAEKRGLIVAGPTNSGNQNAAEIARFAEQMNWPVIADPLSGLRGSSNAISTGDWLFKVSPTLPADFQPEVILRTGSTLVSAPISSWLKTRSARVIYLDADYEWDDAALSTATVISAPAAILSTLSLRPADRGWLQRWLKLNDVITSAIQESNDEPPLTAPEMIKTFSQVLQPGTTMFVSNSMAVREMDAYFAPVKSGVQVLGNRGANGIDGINSTALGVASTRSSSYLYTGELAFFHDLNGLMMARQNHLNLKIIIQNNNGGGIFSLLPQAEEKGQFEKVFGTPLNLNIHAVARLYDADYQRVTSSQALAAALLKPQSGLVLIEVPTSRATIAAQWAEMTARVAEKIRGLLK